MATPAPTKRTGRPRQLRAQLQFRPLDSSARVQAEEVACLVSHYLHSHFPSSARAFDAEATAAMPSLPSLLPHAVVPLADLLSELVAAKQREADERSAVDLLARTVRGGGRREEEKEEKAGGREEDDYVASTFASLHRLLKDYNGHRQRAKQVAPPPHLRTRRDDGTAHPPVILLCNCSDWRAEGQAQAPVCCHRFWCRLRRPPSPSLRTHRCGQSAAAPPANRSSLLAPFPHISSSP